MFLLSSLCLGEWNVQWRGKVAAGQRAASSSLKSSETGELGKTLCAVRFCIFFFSCFFFCDFHWSRNFGVIYLCVCKFTLRVDWTTPNHPDMVVKTIDEGLLLLTLYVLQLWWLKNTIHPNSMVSKQQDLFYSWICIVDKAHQGQLVSALPIVTEGWGWNHLSGPLAWHLGWEDQKSWWWEQVGASGYLFMWSLCMVSPALQGHCGLQSHVSRAGGSAHWANAILALDLASKVLQYYSHCVLSGEDIAMAHLVQGKGNTGPTAWWRSVCVSLIKSSMWDGLCWWGYFCKI